MLKKTALAALAGLLGALVLLTGSPVALAQGAARVYLERRHEEVNRILREPAETDDARRARSERLTRLLSELLDYEAVSRRALADHWEAQPAEERTRFVALLRQLVERNYETNLERILDYEVSYDAEAARDGETVVTTTARSRTQRRQPPVEIAYTLQRTDGAWRVVDVSTDGVGMVQNYRSQFHRIITRDGWAELIARMERRLASGE